MEKVILLIFLILGFNLKEMESFDDRHEDAEEIYYNMIWNWDYDNWVFSDERISLMSCSDHSKTSCKYSILNVMKIVMKK